MKLSKGILLTSLALTFTLGLTACQKDPATEAAETTDNTIKVGVVGENNEHWKLITEKLKAEGITVELVKFSDYTMPNQALNDKEIDVNDFQHIAFYENELSTKKYDFTILAETRFAHFGLYSKKIKSIDELVENDKIAIASDATNGGRALTLLENAGLITLDHTKEGLPELSHILDNPLNLEIIEVEAAQTPSLLDDVAAAMINGGHAVDNGFIPLDDAILLEEVNKDGDNRYVNILVCRQSDKDRAVFDKLLEAYLADDVADLIVEAYGGAYVATWK